jgi:hypothetical protein
VSPHQSPTLTTSRKITGGLVRDYSPLCHHMHERPMIVWTILYKFTRFTIPRFWDPIVQPAKHIGESGTASISSWYRLAKANKNKTMYILVQKPRASLDLIQALYRDVCGVKQTRLCDLRGQCRWYCFGPLVIYDKYKSFMVHLLCMPKINLFWSINVVLVLCQYLCKYYWLSLLNKIINKAKKAKLWTKSIIWYLA